MTHQEAVARITQHMLATRQADARSDFESAHGHEDAVCVAFARYVADVGDVALDANGAETLGQITELARAVVAFLDEKKGDRWYA